MINTINHFLYFITQGAYFSRIAVKPRNSILINKKSLKAKI